MNKKELLQALFYDLLRDASPAGDIERAVKEFEVMCHELKPDKVLYTNAHLARYANELSERVLCGLEESE